MNDENEHEDWLPLVSEMNGLFTSFAPISISGVIDANFINTNIVADVSGALKAIVGEPLYAASLLNAFAGIELGKVSAFQFVASEPIATMQSVFGTVAEFANPLASIIEPLSEMLERDRSNARELQHIFEEAGLWISPSTPLMLWHRVIKLHKAGELTAKKLQEMMILNYREKDCERLTRIVEAWNDVIYFQQRHHILIDALQAHIEHKFTLSVPALLPSIEGIMRDFTNYRKTKTKELQELVKAEVEIDEGLGLVSELKFLHELGILYGFADKFAPLPDGKLNRHSVLHGGDTQYHIELNSLRCFLFLDHLHQITLKRLNKQ